MPHFADIVRCGREFDFEEEWKEIEGCEGRYYISNYGRVLSTVYSKPRILKTIINKGGYECVRFYIDGKVVTYYVHRLVANAFLENEENLPQVNHKDECKHNNCVDNLEWCTAKNNCNYGNRNLKISKNNIGKHYIQQREHLQHIAEAKLGTKMLNNGLVNVYVKKDEIETYLNNGYVLGMKSSK